MAVKTKENMIQELEAAWKRKAKRILATPYRLASKIYMLETIGKRVREIRVRWIGDLGRVKV